MRPSPARFPIPFLALALLALLAALWAGLVRIGWQVPDLAPSLILAHGPLMVSGFLGTLITLERAVALKQRWMYLAPLFAGLGALLTFLIPSVPIGPILLTLGSLGGVLILAVMARREPALHTLTMLIGALMWLTGSLLWLLGWQIFQVVFCWQAFLVLTIAGERLELSRVLRPSRGQQAIFGAIAFVYLGGTVLALFNMQAGARVAGVSLLVLALWSLRNDIAWRNLQHKISLTRYIAWCLAAGFVWLGLGGLLAAGFGVPPAGPWYDAALHTVFIGFVISMIFGHAPIIFPAVLGTPIQFHPAFYIHLGLLHLSLLLRVAGDYLMLAPLRMWGGLLNEIAILIFLGVTIYSIRAGVPQKR